MKNMNSSKDELIGPQILISNQDIDSASIATDILTQSSFLLDNTNELDNIPNSDNSSNISEISLQQSTLSHPIFSNKAWNIEDLPSWYALRSLNPCVAFCDISRFHPQFPFATHWRYQLTSRRVPVRQYTSNLFYSQKEDKFQLFPYHFLSIFFYAIIYRSMLENDNNILPSIDTFLKKKIINMD